MTTKLSNKDSISALRYLGKNINGLSYDAVFSEIDSTTNSPTKQKIIRVNAAWVQGNFDKQYIDMMRKDCEREDFLMFAKGCESLLITDKDRKVVQEMEKPPIYNNDIRAQNWLVITRVKLIAEFNNKATMVKEKWYITSEEFDFDETKPFKEVHSKMKDNIDDKSWLPIATEFVRDPYCVGEEICDKLVNDAKRKFKGQSRQVRQVKGNILELTWTNKNIRSEPLKIYTLGYSQIAGLMWYPGTESWKGK